jgi:hypothetical protein
MGTLLMLKVNVLCGGRFHIDNLMISKLILIPSQLS